MMSQELKPPYRDLGLNSRSIKTSKSIFADLLLENFSNECSIFWDLICAEGN